MDRNFKQAIEHRRSIYALDNKITIPETEIQEIVNHAVLYAPSAFNSQSARVVLLFGKHHQKLWEIVKNTLRAIVSADTFKATEEKIDASFASGYGTILFFEDMSVVESFQETYPSYSDNFPIWSMQSSGMIQFAIWTMLEDAGLGASLQHYNPLIDDKVKAEWGIASSWKLMSEMPFGNPVKPAGAKEFQKLDKRIKIFR